MTNPTDADRLAELREWYEGADPGAPWKITGQHNLVWHIASDSPGSLPLAQTVLQADAELVVALHNAATWLFDLAEEALRYRNIIEVEK